MVAHYVEQRRPRRKRELRLDAIYDQRGLNLFWPKDCGFRGRVFLRHSDLRRSWRDSHMNTWQRRSIRDTTRAYRATFRAGALRPAPFPMGYRGDNAAMTTRMRAIKDGLLRQRQSRNNSRRPLSAKH